MVIWCKHYSTFSLKASEIVVSVAGGYARQHWLPHAIKLKNLFSTVVLFVCFCRVIIDADSNSFAKKETKLTVDKDFNKFLKTAR